MWITIEDIENRWVSDNPITLPDANLQSLIDDAEDLVLVKVPDLQERLESGAVTLRTVQRVLSSVVIRVLRNPEGYRSISEAVGESSRSYTHSGDTPGGLYLEADELSDLQGSTVKRSRAYSVQARGEGEFYVHGASYYPSL